ncbi:MAG: hypothetical protein ACFNLZ_05645, partial [Haemophilus parainfluenzae]
AVKILSVLVEQKTLGKMTALFYSYVILKTEHPQIIETLLSKNQVVQHQFHFKDSYWTREYCV